MLCQSYRRRQFGEAQVSERIEWRTRRGLLICAIGCPSTFFNKSHSCATPLLLHYHTRADAHAMRDISSITRHNMHTRLSPSCRAWHVDTSWQSNISFAGARPLALHKPNDQRSAPST